MINWATASELDRADQQRSSSTWVAEQWSTDGAVLIAVDDRARFATESTDAADSTDATDATDAVDATGAAGTRLRLSHPEGGYDDQRHHLLGTVRGAPVFAVQTALDGELQDFRQVAAALSDVERDIAATASALTQWHQAEPRCPACGEPTRVIKGGFARHCASCGHDHFPRTDPAVIVAVLDSDDRLLLGRQASWPPRRVSILAGFVETGESLEQAIHREIAEEVGVQLAAVRYYGSQPWPFPRSLMLGFSARADTVDVCVDGDEIAFAAWFSRQEVRDQVASGELGLPGPSSIAHRMIHSWLEGDLAV